MLSTIMGAMLYASFFLMSLVVVVALTANVSEHFNSTMHGQRPDHNTGDFVPCTLPGLKNQWSWSIQSFLPQKIYSGFIASVNKL